MFGGVYIYCDDLFIATVHDATLYFKADAHTAPEFFARCLPQFSYSKQGGVASLQYFQAPEEVFSDAEAMRFWGSKHSLRRGKMRAQRLKPARQSSACSKVQMNKRGEA